MRNGAVEMQVASSMLKLSVPVKYDLTATGKTAAYLPDADAIVAHLAQHAQGGDVICVFSNGGFGGIHAKLMARLGRK